MIHLAIINSRCTVQRCILFIIIAFSIPYVSLSQDLLTEDLVGDFIENEEVDQLDSLITLGYDQFPSWSDLEVAQYRYYRGILSVHLDDYAIAKEELQKGLNSLPSGNRDLEYKMRSKLVQAFQHSYELDSMKMELNILDEMEQYSDPLSKAMNHYAHYIYHYRGESKDVALENILAAREILDELGRNTEAARFDSYIGRLYQDLDDDTLAAYYQNRALDYLIANEELESASYVYLERGSFYNGKGEFEKARDDLEECIRLAEITGNLSNVANASQFISSSYANLKEYDLAEKALDRSMEICEEYDIEICFVYANMYYANLFLLKGDYDEALGFAKTLSEYSLDHYPDEVRQGYGLLADINEAKGEFQSAYEAKLKETALADSLFQV